ncbi:MAG TPA: hypothetical protein VL262_11305 [Vicinamibacterales bacterium]|nr:hypothetical protein [Vicinamibacterales bacterium]
MALGAGARLGVYDITELSVTAAWHRVTGRLPAPPTRERRPPFHRIDCAV